MKKIIGVTIIAVTFLTAIYLYPKLTEITRPPEHLISNLPAKYGEAALKKVDSYLIRNVSVIPMYRDTILAHHSVLIRNGRIQQIASFSDGIDTSSNPFLIDGAGKYLIPGLNDMHVHLNDDNNLLLFIANGVTTVRNMAGFDFHLELREKINKHEILGPTFFTTGPILEGVDKVWNFSIELKTKNDARDAVKKYKKQGYDFIKIYHTLPEDVYKEILRVGDSLDIPVVGHIPFNVDLNQTLSSNQYSMEHIDLRPISTDIPLAKKEEMIGKSKKWMCPTLVVHRNIQKSPDDPSMLTQYEQYVDKNTRKFWKYRFRKSENVFDSQKKMAERIFYHGGRFITGTDCLNSYVLAGFSIHEELEELVNAGLSEYEVLKASTVNAAEFLKRQDEIGTIEIGKIADLILLDGNPLEDIGNTRKINGVVVKGKWFNSNELDNILMDVKQSYSN